MLINTSLGRISRAVPNRHNLRCADRHIGVIFAARKGPEEAVLVLRQGGFLEVRLGGVELPLDVEGGRGAVGRKDVVEVLHVGGGVGCGVHGYVLSVLVT